MPKTMYVEKSIVIDKDVHDVFEYLKFAKNQANFSVWSLRDPQQKTADLGTDGTVGFVHSWDSQMENIGAGRQEIKDIVQDQEIKYELKFERPMESHAESLLKVDKTGDNHTKVTWSMESPVDDSMLAGMDAMQEEVGADLEESLQNLKKLMES